MRNTTPTNTAWRDRYPRLWRWSLAAAIALHAGAFFFLPRTIADRLHEALIPPPDVFVVAGSPGSEMRAVALAAPRPPAETPPPEPEPEEKVAVPVPSETPEQQTVGQTSEAPSETAGREGGVAGGEGSGEPAGGGGGVSSPRPIHLVVPQVPRGVDKRRAHGESVHLLVEVLADGTVGEVRVEKGSRIEQLNLAAVDAARQIRYLPATRDGVGIAQWTRTEIRF